MISEKLLENNFATVTKIDKKIFIDNAYHFNCLMFTDLKNDFAKEFVIVSSFGYRVPREFPIKNFLKSFCKGF